MKAIRKVESGVGAELVDIDIPGIGDADLLVKVKAAALCKSDVDVYQWTPLVAASNYLLPFTMGHEFIGEVVDKGKNAGNFSIGDHVAGETHIPCGYCHTCRTGNRHICSNNMGVIGRNVDGAFAGYIRLPQISAVKMDKKIPVVQGALMEPLGTALHAVTEANVSGKTVAVMGCGVIGVMAVELSKLLGATKVIAVSTTRAKLDSALKHGADIIINSKNENLTERVLEETRGIGVEAVIETTGNQKIINQSMEVLQVAGKCVFVGMIDYPLVFDRFMKNVVYKELKLTGIFGRRMYETWEVMLDLLEYRNLDLADYVGAELPLSQFKQAVEMFPDTCGRIILRP